jgi:hypothetical protein
LSAGLLGYLPVVSAGGGVAQELRTSKQTSNIDLPHLTGPPVS